MFNKNKIEIYLLPVLVFAFIITYYLYQFYEEDFKKIFSYVPFSLSKSQYNDVMEQHPYYMIYKISKEVKNPEKNIVYVKTKVDSENKQYLHELNIMMDYYFYPHKIKGISVDEFKKLILTKDNVIISDYPLAPNLYSVEHLKPMDYSKSPYLRVNRKKEDDVFIFTPGDYYAK